MNPARDYRHFLRRPSQRPSDSGVHRLVREYVDELQIDTRDCAPPVRPAPREDTDPVLEARLAMAQQRIAQLELELFEEREQRLLAEERLEVVREEAREEERRLSAEKLEKMSKSYHETLSALRRAYEQRIRREEGPTP